MELHSNEFKSRIMNYNQESFNILLYVETDRGNDEFKVAEVRKFVNGGFSEFQQTDVKRREFSSRLLDDKDNFMVVAADYVHTTNNDDERSLLYFLVKVNGRLSDTYPFGYYQNGLEGKFLQLKNSKHNVMGAIDEFASFINYYFKYNNWNCYHVNFQRIVDSDSNGKITTFDSITTLPSYRFVLFANRKKDERSFYNKNGIHLLGKCIARVAKEVEYNINEKNENINIEINLRLANNCRKHGIGYSCSFEDVICNLDIAITDKVANFAKLLVLQREVIQLLITRIFNDDYYSNTFYNRFDKVFYYIANCFNVDDEICDIILDYKRKSEKKKFNL